MVAEAKSRRRSKKAKAEELAQDIAGGINIGLEASANAAQALLESRPPDQVEEATGPTLADMAEMGSEDPPPDAWDNETKSMLAPSPSEELDPPPPSEDDMDGGIEIGQTVLDKAEAFDRIVKLSEEVDRLRAKAENLQKKYKAAKNTWESRVEDLQRLIKKSTEKLPLFDGFQEDDEPEDEDFDEDMDDEDRVTDAELSHAARQAEARRAETDAALKEPDGWKRVPINHLVIKHDLPVKIQDLLKAGKIETIGDLAEYTALGKELGDIKGMTQNRREQLDAATDRFWATHGKADERPVERREDPEPVPTPQPEPQPLEPADSVAEEHPDGKEASA